MKSPFRLALGLVVLIAFPLAASAQGIVRPGMPNPDAVGVAGP
jgi:hypothetical protein